VIVSGLAYPGSTPRKALDLALSQAAVLASAATLGELARVLGRRKIRRYLAVDEAAAFLARFSQRSVSVLVTSDAKVVRDPDDNAFVNLAIDGAADFLVTGDQDLLVLGTVGKSRIVTPAAFLDFMRPVTPKR
jgi:putative PIN family toxin of toxin-antitoxin system